MVAALNASCRDMCARSLLASLRICASQLFCPPESQPYSAHISHVLRMPTPFRPKCGTFCPHFVPSQRDTKRDRLHIRPTKEPIIIMDVFPDGEPLGLVHDLLGRAHGRPLLHSTADVKPERRRRFPGGGRTEQPSSSQQPCVVGSWWS